MKEVRSAKRQYFLFEGIKAFTCSSSVIEGLRPKDNNRMTGQTVGNRRARQQRRMSLWRGVTAIPVFRVIPAGLPVLRASLISTSQAC